ncbi:MAG: helix-turn-helix transcriptional regulator [Lachnospiraceae bacterium]|nr:helix-turn-helix transcriptional regulator [Lachnospiraceae bacterium]
MNNIKLAQNLVSLRRKRGITQEVIADFLGVTKASVSKWETGLSLPDILQLPKLASYYDISIDELMGYEAQLSEEEIKKYYEMFSKDFATKNFDEVIEEIRNFIRQYYSCCPALLQIVILLLNHYMLAEVSVQAELLEEMVQLCEHIQRKSLDVNLCINATVLQSMIEVSRGKPEIAIEKLEPYYNEHNLKNNSEEILVQAYQMNGQMEKALEWNQFIIFGHLLSLIENSVIYLISNLDNKEVALETIQRVQKIIEVYQVDNLHPNSYLKFQYAQALFYATYGMEKEASVALKTYVEDGIFFVKNALYLHGDYYFNKLDGYFQKIEAITVIPRDKETILQSIIKDLENPLFTNIVNTPEFEEIKKNIGV